MRAYWCVCRNVERSRKLPVAYTAETGRNEKMNVQKNTKNFYLVHCCLLQPNKILD